MLLGQRRPISGNFASGWILICNTDRMTVKIGTVFCKDCGFNCNFIVRLTLALGIPSLDTHAQSVDYLSVYCRTQLAVVLAPQLQNFNCI